MGFGLENGLGAQETVVTLLQQVVGELTVTRHPGEVGPQHSGRPVIKAPERVLVHLERQVGSVGGRTRPEIGDSRVKGGVANRHSFRSPSRPILEEMT